MQPRTQLANDTLRFVGQLPFPIPSYPKLITDLEISQWHKTQQHHHQNSPWARDDLECLNSTPILEIILLTPDEIHPGQIAVSASALFCISPCWDSSNLPYILNQPLFFIVFFKKLKQTCLFSSGICSF